MRKLFIATLVASAILVSKSIFLCSCSSSSAEQGNEQEIGQQVEQNDTECIWDGAEFWLTYESYNNVLQLHATATKGPGYLLTGTDNTYGTALYGYAWCPPPYTHLYMGYTHITHSPEGAVGHNHHTEIDCSALSGWSTWYLPDYDAQKTDTMYLHWEEPEQGEGPSET